MAPKGRMSGVSSRGLAKASSVCLGLSVYIAHATSRVTRLDCLAWPVRPYAVRSCRTSRDHCALAMSACRDVPRYMATCRDVVWRARAFRFSRFGSLATAGPLRLKPFPMSTLSRCRHYRNVGTPTASTLSPLESCAVCAGSVTTLCPKACGVGKCEQRLRPERQFGVHVRAYRRDVDNGSVQRSPARSNRNDQTDRNEHLAPGLLIFRSSKTWRSPCCAGRSSPRQTACGDAPLLRSNGAPVSSVRATGR